MVLRGEVKGGAEWVHGPIPGLGTHLGPTLGNASKRLGMTKHADPRHWSRSLQGTYLYTLCWPGVWGPDTGIKSYTVHFRVY